MASEPERGTPAPNTSERMGGTLRSKIPIPKGITEDMYRPLIFGNRQTQFKIFNVVVCVGVGTACMIETHHEGVLF